MPLALRLGFPPRTLPTAVHFRVICYGVRWGALFRLFPPACPPTRLLHRACGGAAASWCAVCREKALRPGWPQWALLLARWLSSGLPLPSHPQSSWSW